MKKCTLVLTASAVIAGILGMTRADAAVVVTPDTNGTDLLNALVPNQSQFNSISAQFTVGDPSQIGTYTGFNSPPVTFGNGVVMSTGLAAETANPPSGADIPSSDLGGGSTPEIDAYAPTHITNWQASFDAAVLAVNFDLATASAIAFNFVFGSIEFPKFVNNFTDSALVFLDGQQITFDSANNPVQVGTTFANLLTTADTNTAFADPHGLLKPLTTTSGTLGAGSHTLLFEISDTNDHILDSAIFLSNLRTTTNPGGPVTEPEEVPEPASMLLLGFGLAAMGLTRRRTPMRRFAPN